MSDRISKTPDFLPEQNQRFGARFLFKRSGYPFNIIALLYIIRNHSPHDIFASVPWWCNAAPMCSKLYVFPTPLWFGRLSFVKCSDWPTMDELKCAGHPQSRLQWYSHWSLFPPFSVGQCAGWVPPSFALHRTLYAIDKWSPYRHQSLYIPRISVIVSAVDDHWHTHYRIM